MARGFHSAFIMLGTWLGIGIGYAMAEPSPVPPASPAPTPPESCHAVPAGASVTSGTRWEPSVTGPVAEGEVRRGPVRKFLYHVTHPFCWCTHNDFGCSSLHSECVFVFGSCRAFFGQACLKKPSSKDGPGSSDGCGCP
jgi:hypothetical protein